MPQTAPKHQLRATGCCGCLVLLAPIIITAAAATIATYIIIN